MAGGLQVAGHRKAHHAQADKRRLHAANSLLNRPDIALRGPDRNGILTSSRQVRSNSVKQA
jgi:hypothetical protein